MYDIKAIKAEITYSLPGYVAFGACVVVVERQIVAWSRGRGFNSHPLHCRVWHWASCSLTSASVIKQCNLVPVEGRWCSETWKVTVDLASQWPSEHQRA